MALKDIIDQYEFDVIYDTETSNLPNWKIPSDDPEQPHIVSIAAVKCERKTGNIIGSLNLIIKQDNWECSKEAFETHKITKEYSIKVGVNEFTAVLLFAQFCQNSMRVCYNQTFDQRIVRICLKRNGLTEAMDEWARMDNHACAMRMAANVMKLPPYGKYGWRNPKLEVAYKHFTGNELIGAHGAMADTMAARDVFYSIVNANGGKIPIPGNSDQATIKQIQTENEETTIDDDSEALFGQPSDQPVDQDETPPY